VYTLGCPREALAEVRKTNFDVVVVNLLDLLENGILFLRGVKRHRPLTEVITLSVASGMRLSMEGMKAGAFADINMPFDLEDLAAKVAEAWKKKARAARGLAGLRQKLENLAASAAFAEAADFDTARALARPFDEDDEQENEEDFQ
ncbi:MAG: hypothetical protein ABIJ95_09365, partial [Pseudomonadota bacterium]